MSLLIEYQNFKEKEKYFSVKKIITKKEEFDVLFENLLLVHNQTKSNSSSFWRGLPESKFKHYTSLQRFWIENDFDANQDSIIEYLKHCFNFTRNWNQQLLVKYYKNYSISNFSFFASLSLLRHFGAPTPVLDFSKSPLVALFFAAKFTQLKFTKNEIEKCFSLYELKENHGYHKLDYKSMMKRAYEGPTTVGFSKEKTEEITKEYFSKHVINEESFYLQLKRFPIFKIDDLAEDEYKLNLNNNYNITNQEGLFYLNSDVINPFEDVTHLRIEQLGKINKSEAEILGAKAKFIDNFISYEIHKNLKEYALKKLYDIGINEDFIFPNINQMVQDCVKDFMENRIT